MKYKALSSVIFSVLLLSGCSSSDDTNAGSVSITGYYLDAAVQNLDYKTLSGSKGLTGKDGSFVFVKGDKVDLHIGNLVLRSLTDITDGQKFIEDSDANIMLLQSIDEDGDPSNGIQVTQSAKDAVQAWLGSKTTLDINTSDANSSKHTLLGISDLETKLRENGLTQTKSVTRGEAKAHLQTTIEAEKATLKNSKLGTQLRVGNKINYVDYKGEIRESSLSAGDAEYHTGVGFGNTLFDSAEKKCQNCHNELYDTWEGSMHGKSWNDPIFQSKFQDFLRTHLAKIGTNPTGEREYTEKIFKGASQTCIKCHAPGAYYAGDVKVTVNELQDATSVSATLLDQLKAQHEVNSPNGETVVIAASKAKNKIYKASFQIGHEANREGINCAFCHSIETPRLMGLGKDSDTYTLVSDIREGPHGHIKAGKGTDLKYNKDATNPDMNKFFRLWGPEMYHKNDGSSTDIHTPKDANNFDIGKTKDGRYTMVSKDLNATDGKTHYTGGPFYGPFGVTGISNENAHDDTNRSAHINPHFNPSTGENHFAENGKSLCLSCHQRSAGAVDPRTKSLTDTMAGDFMELCSTWNAVTTGTDNNHEETMSSPNCQKCHMERVDGTLLHQWAKPDQLIKDKALLTPHFYPDDSANHGSDNPVSSGWYNSHAFLGASKTGGDKKAAVAKIKSGFGADVSTNSDGNTLTVTTTITNKTGHMFPGAHPMRRVLTRVIVTDADGVKLNPTSTTGNSTFATIENTVATLSGKTISPSGHKTVRVEDAGSADLNFAGKSPDLNGSSVPSQRFYSDSGVGKVTIAGVDGTLKSQTITNGATTGLVFNAAIVDSNATQKFTRIYAHETGKMYDVNGVKTFIVRPGFDSNLVQSDTRLSPNETETYTLTYDITGKTGVSATYKVYYMQKGANGQFLEATDGFLDQAKSDAAKHLVTEVFTKTVSE